MLLSTALAASAHGQQPPPTAQPTTGTITDQELAISVDNPFEDFVKLPVESDTGFGLGPHHRAGDSLNIAPVVPFSLNAQWDLIAQPSLTVTYLPSPHEQFGLEDSQASFFLTPAKETTWIWGAGPIFQFPTASTSGLGTGAGRLDQPRHSSTRRVRGSTLSTHTSSCRLPEIATAAA